MSALWFGVLAHLWQTTIVLALLGGLALALERAPARYQEWLWTAALVKVLVPIPLIAAYWPWVTRWGRGVGEPISVGPAIGTLSQLANPDFLRMSAPEPQVAASPVGLIALTALWGVGVALLLATWWSRSRLPVPEQQEPWHAADSIVERLGRASRAAGVPLHRVRLTPAAVMPCVRNLWRPVLVISTAVVEKLSVEELRAVLVHEDAHRRRADLWRATAYGAATCLFFFYPPVWWLRRRLRDAAELACDEFVLAAGIDPGTYSRALATTVNLGLAAPGQASLAARNSSLRERLGRIREPNRYTTMRRHRFAVVAAFILAFSISFIPVADGGAVSAAIGGSQQDQWLPASDLVGLAGLATLVEMRYSDVPLSFVFQQLGERVGFEVEFEGSGLSSRISVGFARLSVRDVLELLAQDSGIEYRSPNTRTLVVRRTGVRHERPVRPFVQRTPIDRSQGPPYRVGGDIQEPEKIHNVPPRYPELARRARLEGFVILEAIVDRNGNVKDARVLRGLGLGLDVAALDAVRQWRYTPTYYNGEPVEVILTVNVVFQLLQ